MTIIISAVVIIFALLAFWLIGIYNHLVRLRNRVRNAWAQIDVQLQRRYDLIPNLVEAVKGYIDHEKSTLTDVVNARNMAHQALQKVDKAGGPTSASIQELLSAESMLQAALPKLFAVAESYPDLKASENVKMLQEEISTTENKVAFSRQSYNDIVLGYNNAQEVFPNNLVASPFGHSPAEMFEITDERMREAPKVSLSTR
ncbi:MAG: LemA family protein [Waddliaceae bacterium]